ncbi:MAG TPA: ABC transporter ATP-binding protein [Candidatus Ornithospirochaeta stercorigallinarum]|nr:ABC transporter ATP-binding protein [Candidatus Ornithospirochaeta stercorigallinarum]
MSDLLLSIDKISVKYGSIEALHEVSMHVRKGDIVSLIGANGAGKSTLLKAIMAQVPLSTGSISFEGEEICSAKKHVKTTHQLAAIGMALVPEGRHVFADMTVEENLDMGAFLVKDSKLIERKKEEMFDFFPILSQRRKQKTRSLSGGEQQMMAIARALMSSPKLLLLDEPGLGLAPLIVQDIFHKIRKINEEDKVTIFLVEQNARMALKNSTTGYVMETGNIVLADSSENLLNDDKVRAAYLGE